MNAGKDVSELSVILKRLNLVMNVPRSLAYLADPASPFNKLYPKLKALEPLGDINLLGDLEMNGKSIDFEGSFDSDCGNLDINGNLFKQDKQSPLEIVGTVSTLAFNRFAL